MVFNEYSRQIQANVTFLIPTSILCMSFPLSGEKTAPACYIPISELS